MAIASTEFDYIRSLVLERSALVLEPGKEYRTPEGRPIKLAGKATPVRELF